MIEFRNHVSKLTSGGWGGGGGQVAAVAHWWYVWLQNDRKDERSSLHLERGSIFL